MSLVIARSYASPRRMGRSKALEQSGDWQRMTEYLVKLSQAHGDFDTAAELRAQLDPPVSITVETEAAPVKAKRCKRKMPTPSKLTPSQANQQAWEELRLRRGV